MIETEFQARIMRHLNRPNSGFRVWRQNAGKWETAGGDWIHGAPEGAADITGIRKSDGRRIEIECKVGRGRQTKAQRAWEDFVERSGGIYVLVRHVPRKHIDDQLAALEDWLGFRRGSSDDPECVDCNGSGTYWVATRPVACHCRPPQRPPR